VTFGAAEYVWHPFGVASHAEPAGPAKRRKVKEGEKIVVAKASVMVITGRVE
jgi:hypothetical protein